ncbi:MAG: hypothetical protein QW035_03020 [Candidatus Anstonellales archaeon]
MIEDELVHWWKDEQGGYKKTFVRIESDPPREENGFPRDGFIYLKVVNGEQSAFIKLSVGEALYLSAQLEHISKMMLYQKRQLWNSKF